LAEIVLNATPEVYMLSLKDLQLNGMEFREYLRNILVSLAHKF